MAIPSQTQDMQLADPGDKETKKRKLDCKPLETKYQAIKVVEARKKKQIEIATDFGVN